MDHSTLVNSILNVIMIGSYALPLLFYMEGRFDYEQLVKETEFLNTIGSFTTYDTTNVGGSHNLRYFRYGGESDIIMRRSFGFVLSLGFVYILNDFTRKRFNELSDSKK